MKENQDFETENISNLFSMSVLSYKVIQFRCLPVLDPLFLKADPQAISESSQVFAEYSTTCTISLFRFTFFSSDICWRRFMIILIFHLENFNIHLWVRINARNVFKRIFFFQFSRQNYLFSSLSYIFSTSVISRVAILTR